ncbi:DNA-directed RNA polymerase I subunit [Colletotrichum tofieldiae]|nr:DNA-directed RNA polymerase I subunit [Colletotrichum tofieldiae]
MPSPNSPSRPGTVAAMPAAPGIHRVAVAPAVATPPGVRATLAMAESLQDPRKFPAAPNSSITTPSIRSTPVSRLAPPTTPGTMSSRKLDGVHSLSALLEKQSQEPALGQSKSKFARSTQSKAKNEKKFDPRAADSDEDEDTSSSDGSDDDGPTVPNFVNKLNGQGSSSKPAGTPLKKAKRGKEDEVADSDVERKTSSAKPTSTKKAPVKPESSSEESSSESEAEVEASDSSDSSSESESESKKKNPAPKASAKVAPANSASTTSSSESESESEDEAAKPAAKPAVNGTKATKPASTSSSETSSSDEEESGDEEEEKSGSEEDSSDDESDKEAANESVAVTARRNSKDLSVPGFVGKDFVLRQAQGDEDGKDMNDFFAKAKLDGKQLWYFTAPASIPINVVEKLQIPMDKAQNGDAIFKHNSEDYTVGFDVGSTAVQLLIPNKKGTRYEQASQKVDKVLHVKRVTQLVGSEPRAPRSIQPNAARPQPPGLRARFHPIGVSDDTPLGTIGFDASSDSDEDVDMAPAPALPSSSKKPKRASTQPAVPQDDAMDIDEPTPKNTKKDKKKSKTARDPVQDSQSTVIEVPNSQPLPSKKEKKSKKRRDSIESISSVGSNPKPALLKGQKGAVATPDQSKKASKRKVPADEEETSAQLAKEAASADKKAKKLKRDADNSSQEAGLASAKKVTAIPPPTIPKASYSFSNLPAGSSPAPQISTPQPKSKSKGSKKSKGDEPALPSSSQTASARKETPVQPPSVRRESTVPIPQVPLKSSPAAETPKKEKRKRRKSEKTEEPKSAKKETPIPAPKV